MICPLHRETLSAYWDGELEPFEAEAVRVHVADCGACLRELDALKKGTSRLRALRDRKAPPWLADAVRREIRRMRLQWIAALAGAAALFLVALGVILLSTPPAPPAERPAAAQSTAVIAISADDLGTVREEVEGLLRDLHAPVLIGAPDLGTDPALKDTCLTTYLTAAERDAVERHVESLTGRISGGETRPASPERRRVVLQFVENQTH
jgi:hypothetical protein